MAFAACILQIAFANFRCCIPFKLQPCSSLAAPPCPMYLHCWRLYTSSSRVYSLRSGTVAPQGGSPCPGPSALRRNLFHSLAKCLPPSGGIPSSMRRNLLKPPAKSLQPSGGIPSTLRRHLLHTPAEFLPPSGGTPSTLRWNLSLFPTTLPRLSTRTAP